MIPGKRVYLADDELPVNQGEYGRSPIDEKWYARVPAEGFGVGSLAKHDVIEHEDGTITVAPSILMTGHDGKQWHGYLTKGIWREV